MPSFQLRKYYLDCVTEDGAGCIGYVARLAWGPLRLRYAALLQWPAGQPACEAHTLQRVPEPRLAGGELQWHCPPLGVRARWEGAAPAAPTTLLEGPAGCIRWEVLAPRAPARLQTGPGQTMVGSGYVERLSMTIEPWRLPIDTLYWGRYHAAGDALVWVGWDGPHRLRHVLHNGRQLGDARFTADGVSFADGSELLFTTTTTLRAAPVVAALARLPRVLRRVPPAFLAAREVKWLSQARLSSPRQPPSSGWALHEQVRFR